MGEKKRNQLLHMGMVVIKEFVHMVMLMVVVKVVGKDYAHVVLVMVIDLCSIF